MSNLGWLVFFGTMGLGLLAWSIGLYCEREFWDD